MGRTSWTMCRDSHLTRLTAVTYCHLWFSISSLESLIARLVAE
jgi:hypothetical protein